MAYMLDEKKVDRLLKALDALGEKGLVIRGTDQEREFILALNAIRDDLPKKDIPSVQ